MKNKKIKKIVIVGAGGMAREVRWLIEDINRQEKTYEFLGYIVSDLKNIGKYDSKELILGDFSWLELNNNKINQINVIIGIGNPIHRLKIAQKLSSLKINIIYPNLIHPSVKFDKSSVKFGKGIIICANTILTVNIKIKDFVLINLLCAIGHETIVCEGSSINMLSQISGGVIIGKGVLIGSGSTILQYLKIGDFSTVGSGAVLTKSIPDKVTAFGIPAKIVE